MRRLWLAAAAFLLSVGVASAGQGWYLLHPPFNDALSPSERQQVMDENRASAPLTERAVDRSRPLREWSHVGAYDSARECERALVDLVKAERKGTLAYVVRRDSICIASDDPRLR